MLCLPFLFKMCLKDRCANCPRYKQKKTISLLLRGQDFSFSESASDNEHLISPLWKSSVRLGHHESSVVPTLSDLVQQEHNFSGSSDITYGCSILIKLDNILATVIISVTQHMLLYLLFVCHTMP